DVVMTSEREWSCYPQVPGIAIAQLSRVDDIDAVLVTRWEWDGSERRRGTQPGARPDALAAAAGAAGGDCDEGPDGPVSPFGEPERAAVVDRVGGQDSLWT
ncbi:hypothetical protein, partial [Streptomyces violaceus]